MRPRPLVLLRIDDRTPARAPRIPSSVSGNVDRPPRGVALSQYGPPERPFVAINRWSNALRFWAEYDGRRRPDLIVGDVRFDADDSTPLNFYSATSDVPTGLSHLKPFAAVARAVGMPIGIGIHTADPGLFERLAGGHSADRRMGLLAAHDIGELAAILGEPLSLDNRTPEELLDACWAWLLRRTEVDFTAAFGKAVEDYRRRLLVFASQTATSSAQLSSLYVGPADWVRLAKWCERMRALPVPLDKDDPGLPLCSGDGLKDCVSLRSIYADAGGGDIGAVALPSECFALESSDEPWALDENRLPRIGALVQALHHSVVAASERAIEVVRHFQVTLEPGERLATSLVDLLPSADVHALERTLVVFYQLVWMYHENWCQWKDYSTDAHWRPDTQTFGASGYPTLAVTLKRIARLMSGSDWFYPNDIASEADGRGHDIGLARAGEQALDWHCQLMAEAGMLERSTLRDPGGRHRHMYRCTGEQLLHVPFPDALPNGATTIKLSPKKFLKETLGFSREYGPNAVDADRTLARCIAEGLDLEADSTRKVTEFIEQFHEGRGPIWLVRICQDYAQHVLRWTDRATWPRALRPARQW